MSLDPASAMVAVWLAGAAAALLVVVGVLLYRRGAGAKPGLALVVIVAVAAATFALIERGALRERLAERRALETRAAALAQVLGANAPLACLDGLAGEAVETACEKALFAKPETVAAAVSYVAARLALLRDGQTLAASDAAFADELAQLRKGMEADRFGLVAHVLATRDDCNASRCAALAQFSDASRIQTNLAERAYDAHVARHAADWSTPDRSPVAEATPSLPGLPSAMRYDFPSAASIPPVSIMNPEPATGAPPANPPAASAPPRRPPARAAQRPAPVAPPAASAPAPPAAASGTAE
jgi:hypothetical protein